MQLSDIKKLKGYYNDLVSAGDELIKEKHISSTAFSVGAVISYLIYGTSFSEYAGYRFYAKKHSEKRTYMTRRYMFRFFDRYNPQELRCRIGDKSLAAKYYADFMKREQCTKSDGFEAFLEFTSRHPDLFIKRAVGWGGEGARKERVLCEEDAARVWGYLGENEVVEPVIINHDLLREIYPNSLNTIKVTVLQTPSTPIIVTAIIRFGNNTIVDNIHSGGIAAGINVKTGRIETLAMDKHFMRYSIHPETDKPITGIVIPQWEAICDLARRASMVTPELRYTSWDVALTNEGPIMIEGNWDAEFYPEQTLFNRGHRTLFTDLLEG
ncbi:MAG: hypothetical protein J5586_03400 [Clostridia bacterium]|nr:hypothetical protein [Clostridia bacterium]